MTTIDPHVAGADLGVAENARVGDARVGGFFATVADWLTTSDHKKIGRLFVGTSLLMLLSVTVVAGLLGFERIDATDTALDAGAIPQLFALYRVTLTFGVVAPLLLGVAIAVVPLQLGARALAFPRVAAAGFWSWVVGAGLVIYSIADNGGPGGGDSKMVDLFLLAHMLLLVGLLAGAFTVATSVLTTRAPGMNMRRVPLFSWSALVGSLGLLLMLPVLIGSMILLYVDHHYARTAFGGNLGVGNWIGFAFTQPQTFLYALPAFGIAAEVIHTATKRRLPMRGVMLTGLGLIGVSAISGVTQVTAAIGQNILDQDANDIISDAVPFAIFNALPVLGGFLVLGVGLFALKNGLRFSSPLVFGFLGAGLVYAGMVAHLVYAFGDAQLTGTVFEEGAWLCVMYGGVLTALGAVVYWGPKLWGRLLDDKKSLPFAGLGFIAASLAAFPLFIAGFADQPGGSVTFSYSGPQELWNTLSLVGHLLLLVVLLAFMGYAIISFSAGDPAGDDPWDGLTLEWATTSPAPADNFADVHVIRSAEPLLDLKPSRSDA